MLFRSQSMAYSVAQRVISKKDSIYDYCDDLSRKSKLLYNVCKKCQKPLPEGYKHKKCESRRNAQVQCVKNGLKVAAGVAGAVASFAVVIVTKGKVNPKK